MAKDKDKVVNFDEVFPSYKDCARSRSDSFGLSCPESDRIVKDEFKDECDINLIMSRFAKTGMLTHVATSQPYYGDVSELVTYQESLAIVEKAQEAFMELPAEIRKDLDNDPSRLMSWLSDPKNRDKAVQYGLMNAPVKESIQKVEIINPVKDEKGEKK